MSAHVHIFFLDGVGMGGDDPAINPFVTANLPNLTGLLGDGWYLRQNGRISTPRASLVPADAALGVDGRPQSATGQAAILTGRNVPQLVGEHYGPKPNKAVAAVIKEGSLFRDVVEAGKSAALITPYPQGYFDAIASGRRLFSSVPLAAVSGGVTLMTTDDLQNGRAVSPDFTAEGWQTHLGLPDMPTLALPQAGKRIAAIAKNHAFSFFEHWPSDRAGHRGDLAGAAAHLEQIDAVVGGLLADWDDENGLLIIISDHGNIEEKTHRRHTTNPVPAILVGRNHQRYAQQLNNLTDIAPIVTDFLQIAV